MDTSSTMVPGNNENASGDVIDELLPIISKRLHSRRTNSFSSSSFSSCSSSFRSTSFDSNPEDSPRSYVLSPQHSRIPFSWEQLPGVPKKSYLNSIHSSPIMLPLPPAATSNSSKKFNFDTMFRKKASSNENSTIDPFTTALVECSKNLAQENLDGYWKKGKVSRGVNDPFGLIDRYISCKSSCTVIRSVVFLPRPSRETYSISRRRQV